MIRCLLIIKMEDKESHTEKKKKNRKKDTSSIQNLQLFDKHSLSADLEEQSELGSNLNQVHKEQEMESNIININLINYINKLEMIVVKTRDKLKIERKQFGTIISNLSSYMDSKQYPAKNIEECIFLSIFQTYRVSAHWISKNPLPTMTHWISSKSSKTLSHKFSSRMLKSKKTMSSKQS